MNRTSRSPPRSESSFFGITTGWGQLCWGSRENGSGNWEEDDENYQNCDYWTQESMQVENKQSSSSSFSSSAEKGSGLSRKEQKSTAIAACFLKDYEGGQPPTLSNDFTNITRRQLLLYRVKHSFHWKIFGLSLGTILLFIPSFNGRLLTAVLHTYSIVVLAIDLYMKSQFLDEEKFVASDMDISGKGRLLFYSMKIFLIFMGLQTFLNLFFPENSMEHAFTLAVSVFKPMVFFYESRRARDALEALIRVSQKLLRVILIELFLILVFATVACRLYYNHENFQSLPQAWLSLFALSTTVVNPSIWMPAYNESPWNAVFFVIFIVVSIFYLHSLVLSVVFQVFIQSATAVHRRSVTDKENSLKLAFLALAWAGNHQKSNTLENEFTAETNALVDMSLICEMLRLLRPHYSQQKLNVLIDIIIPSRMGSGFETRSPKNYQRFEGDQFGNKQKVNFNEFRDGIEQALSSSVRATRTHSTLGIAVEVLSISVSILNFVYVMLFASRVHPDRESTKYEFISGSFITLLTLFEASLRYKLWQHSNRINPITRLNTVLDGMGCFGGVVSIFGVILHLTGHENGMEYLLVGRAIGMIQSMRFSIWFREVLQRSLYVLPLLAGPIFLILTAVHVFVYIGMALWGGTVDVEEPDENIEYLYYLNNFNSYREGCITVFNVLVVNDWHQIANVFLYASNHSSPFIVYLYFVMLVIVAVCILLNVIVAFFVETFVSQLNLVDIENEPLNTTTSRNVSTSALQSEVSTRIAPIARSWIFDSNDLKKLSVRSSSCPTTGEVTEFDVIRREGYDDIIQSVANDNDKQFEDFSRSLLDALDLVNTLTEDRNRNSNIGYMVYSRKSKVQFKSNNFASIVKEYLPGDEDIQSIVGEIDESLSNKNVSSSSLNTCNRAGRFIPNPNDSSRALQVEGTTLPQNDSTLLLTVVINELKERGL